MIAPFSNFLGQLVDHQSLCLEYLKNIFSSSKKNLGKIKNISSSDFFNMLTNNGYNLYSCYSSNHLIDYSKPRVFIHYYYLHEIDILLRNSSDVYCLHLDYRNIYIVSVDSNLLKLILLNKTHD